VKTVSNLDDSFVNCDIAMSFGKKLSKKGRINYAEFCRSFPYVEIPEREIKRLKQVFF
jgi:hypothetical protein